MTDPELRRLVRQTYWRMAGLILAIAVMHIVAMYLK
jgi:hypothetical protein